MRRLALVGLLCLFCWASLAGCRGGDEPATETASKRGRGGAMDPKDLQK